jgi:adenine phosphoribosyltransferase
MNKFLSSQISNSIKVVKNFPKKGILFQDITALTDDHLIFKNIVIEISQYVKNNSISKIIGIEARGFIFAAAAAYASNIPFVPIRKKNKLPGKTYKQKYSLEYGQDEIHIHQNSINKNDRVLIVDDLIATGGTAIASSKLLSKFKPKNISFLMIIDLENLNGSAKIRKNFELVSLYETHG